MIVLIVILLTCILLSISLLARKTLYFVVVCIGGGIAMVSVVSLLYVILN